MDPGLPLCRATYSFQAYPLSSARRMLHVTFPSPLFRHADDVLLRTIRLSPMAQKKKCLIPIVQLKKVWLTLTFGP